jgi:hypothetical protein
MPDLEDIPIGPFADTEVTDEVEQNLVYCDSDSDDEIPLAYLKSPITIMPVSSIIPVEPEVLPICVYIKEEQEVSSSDSDSSVDYPPGPC